MGKLTLAYCIWCNYMTQRLTNLAANQTCKKLARESHIYCTNCSNVKASFLAPVPLFRLVRSTICLAISPWHFVFCSLLHLKRGASSWRLASLPLPKVQPVLPLQICQVYLLILCSISCLQYSLYMGPFKSTFEHAQYILTSFNSHSLSIFKY